MKEEEVYEAIKERTDEVYKAVFKVLPHRDGEHEVIADYRYWFYIGATWADEHPCKYPFVTLLDKDCRWLRQYMSDISDEDMEDFCREISDI